MSIHRNLRIVQYNVHKSKDKVMAPLLEERHIQDVDILAIQEPTYNISNGTTYNPSTSGFFLAHKGGQKVRTCFYINKRLDPSSWEIKYSDDDLCSLRLEFEKRKGDNNDQAQVLWVHNVYNPSPISITSDDSPTSIPILEKALDEEGEHIALGDFNLHHPRWNNKGRYTYHKMADKLIELMDSKGMVLGLPEESITWRRGTTQSAIDLNFLTEGAYQAMTNCKVEENLGGSSDHFAIVTDLEWAWQKEIPKKKRAWKNLERIETEKMVIDQATVLNLELVQMPIDTNKALDDIVDAVNKGFKEIIEKSIPWAQPRTAAKSYWNRECTIATKEAKARLKEHHRNRTLESAENLRLAERAKVKIIRKSRTLHWRENIHEASLKTNGLWGLAKWARERSSKPKPLPQFPSLYDSEGGKVQDFEGKVKALRKVLFPPTPDADLRDIQGTVYPPPILMENPITFEEIYNAIYHSAKDKAPGITGVPNRFLRTIIRPMGDSLTRLFQACLNNGYHPKHFKKANTIILKKPNKSDYAEPKAYRPIALLDTLGKAFETVISRRFTRIAEEYGLLPPQQMGARKNRSVGTALESLTESIHTVWNCGSQTRNTVASLLSLDVAGAFDNVSHTRLIHNLRVKKIPDQLIAWTTSFLKERATSITLGNKTSEMKEIATGIPQGSPISPILYLFFNAPLIEQCVKSNLPVQTGGFVDDIHLLAYGGTTEDNCRVLGKAHKICLHWARTHGASFNPQKYELVHLSRSSKRYNMKASINFDNTIIDPSTNIRILGLQIDSKLRWGPHIAQIKTRAISQTKAISCLTGSTWGATFNKCRTIYNMVIRPMITFAAPIWHNPQELSQPNKPLVKKLAVLQNDCLRKITGAYKATSIPILEAESMTAPMDIHLDHLVMRQQIHRGIHQTTTTNNERIIRYFASRRGPKKKIESTPAKKKAQWATHSLNEFTRARSQNRQTGAEKESKTIKDWEKERRITRWEAYQNSIPAHRKQPAQEGPLAYSRLYLHNTLRKAESSIAIQLRSGKIGFNDFLYEKNVPGIQPQCSCGWYKQNIKHVLMFCPILKETRPDFLAAAGSNNIHQILTTNKGVRAAAKWLLKEAWFDSFILATEQLEKSRLPMEK